MTLAAPVKSFHCELSDPFLPAAPFHVHCLIPSGGTPAQEVSMRRSSTTGAPAALLERSTKPATLPDGVGSASPRSPPLATSGMVAAGAVAVPKFVVGLTHRFSLSSLATSPTTV